MGVRILHDSDQKLAVLYCSTSDWSFGPVFDENGGHDADERASAFLRWLDITSTWSNYEKSLDTGRRDPRELTESGLQRAYTDWFVQETDQWIREEAIEKAKYAAELAEE